jgi:hypothetical protein
MYSLWTVFVDSQGWRAEDVDLVYEHRGMTSYAKAKLSLAASPIELQCCSMFVVEFQGETTFSAGRKAPSSAEIQKGSPCREPKLGRGRLYSITTPQPPGHLDIRLSPEHQESPNQRGMDHRRHVPACNCKCCDSRIAIGEEIENHFWDRPQLSNSRSH